MAGRALGLAITVMIVAGLAAFVYGAVIVPMGSGEPRTSLTRLATDDMSKLQFPGADEAVSLPTRTVLDRNGEETDLSRYAGKVVVLNIWATWCAPCVVEMPSLEQLEDQLGSDRFAVVPVSLDADKAEAVAFYDEQGLDGLPFYQDPDLGIGFDLKAAGMPTTVVFDRRGAEVARLEGIADWHGPAAVAFLEALIAREFAVAN